MVRIVLFFLSSLAVVTAAAELILEPDRPFLRVVLSEPAVLKCCYRGGPVKVKWLQHAQTADRSSNSRFVEESALVNISHGDSSGSWCGTLTIKSVQLNNSGLYRCHLKENVFTHGTYLQVFKPIEKTINISEGTKNKILAAEGVLLLVCVLIPSATLLFKSKNLNELEKKKAKKEAANIYQGLNLDDCCEIYDQIEYSPGRGQYQDVGSFCGKEEDIQLEKP